jgi:hypothetical protein
MSCASPSKILERRTKTSTRQARHATTMLRYPSQTSNTSGPEENIVINRRAGSRDSKPQGRAVEIAASQKVAAWLEGSFAGGTAQGAAGQRHRTGQYTSESWRDLRVQSWSESRTTSRDPNLRRNTSEKLLVQATWGGNIGSGKDVGTPWRAQAHVDVGSMPVDKRVMRMRTSYTEAARTPTRRSATPDVGDRPQSWPSAPSCAQAPVDVDVRGKPVDKRVRRASYSEAARAPSPRRKTSISSAEETFRQHGIRPTTRVAVRPSIRRIPSDSSIDSTDDRSWASSALIKFRGHGIFAARSLLLAVSAIFAALWSLLGGLGSEDEAADEDTSQRRLPRKAREETPASSIPRAPSPASGTSNTCAPEANMMDTVESFFQRRRARMLALNASMRKPRQDFKSSRRSRPTGSLATSALV